MNPEYNVAEASELIDTLYYDAQYYPQEGHMRSILDFESDQYSVVFVEQPRSWRIIEKDDPSKSEVAFEVFGALCHKNLPPIGKNKRLEGIVRNAPLLRQHACVTGLEASGFEIVIDNIIAIHEFFSNALKEEGTTMIPWKQSVYEGDLSVEASARYFTPRKYVRDERGQTFGKGVDPEGILAGIRGQNFIHGADNKVEYLKQAQVDGRARAVRVEPGLFALGDIVKMTVSFICVMNPRTKEVKMNLLMKALTFLNKPQPISAHVINTSSTTPIGIPRMPVIKRRRIVHDDNIPINAIGNMQLSDETVSSE